MTKPRVSSAGLFPAERNQSISGLSILFLDPRFYFASNFKAAGLYNPTTNPKMPSTHKKEKPWDTDDIDKWKVRAHSMHVKQTN